MSELLQISVEAFRAFRDRGTLSLRPLTLLYGPNQAGKSSLLRLLPLLADSVRASGVPILDLQTPALFGASFKELGWLGNEPITTPRLELLLPDEGDRYEMHLADEQGMFVERLRVGPRGGERELDVTLDGDVHSTASELSADYAGSAGNDPDWHGRLHFRSPLPDEVPGPAQERIERLRDRLRRLERLQWLRANRVAPPGSGQSRHTQCCSPDGSDLVSLLERSPGVLEMASRWLRQIVKEEVKIQVDFAGQRQFVLHREGRREPLPVYLAGEGVRSLLPVLLCACWADAGSGAVGTGDGRQNGPTALAIEEPESHLHPRLQTALIDRLIETVKRDIPVILETHSVYMLRAIQLAVLEGRISPESVGIHWVEGRDDGSAEVRLIPVEEDGTLTGWNPEAFEEEQKLARIILEKRWERGNQS